MNALETLRNAIPDAAKDLRLNLGSVLQSNTLTKEQVWGTAVACAIAARNPHRCPRGGVLRHFGRRHRPVVQKPPEPHLPGTRSSKPSDARTGPISHRPVQSGPPFSSRRSPNRPSAYPGPSMSASGNHAMIHRIRPPAAPQEMCECDSRLRGEVEAAAMHARHTGRHRRLPTNPT